MDRVAVDGLKLTQFYVGGPMCSSSRSALLTGRLPQRSGVYTNYTYPKVYKLLLILEHLICIVFCFVFLLGLPMNKIGILSIKIQNEKNMNFKKG